MSKQNNVNPNFYKVGGREPSEGDGAAIVHEDAKKIMREQELPGKKAAPKHSSKRK
jgi:hypothetical protein